MIFLFLYFYCKHRYIFLLGRFSTIFLPRRRGTPPEPRTLQQEQLKQQLQQFPTSASLGSRIPAKQKEGGEHHGKIHPDPLHPLPRIYRNPTRFPYLILQVGAVQLQLLPDRGVTAPAPASRCSSRPPSMIAQGNFLSSIASLLKNQKEFGDSILCSLFCPIVEFFLWLSWQII